MTEMDRHSAMKAYEVAHRILKSFPELGRQEGRESRVAPRHPFKFLQWVAPYDGYGFPNESKFFQIRCRDLSEGGFSFFASERPDFSTLVISLGEPPNQMHMVAEIVHCHEVRSIDDERVEMVDGEEGDGDANDQGDQIFLVGCRFNGRLG